MLSAEEIRALCARVVKAKGKEFDTAIEELQSAIEQRLKGKDEPSSGESR